MSQQQENPTHSAETLSLLELYKLFLTFHKVIPEDNDNKAWNRGYIGGIIRAWYIISEEVRNRIVGIYETENPE